MATSFRLPSEKMQRLQYLAKRLGKSKAQVVIQAIDRLYEEERTQPKKSMLDLLIESGFTPLEDDVGFAAADEDRQRQIIREKLAKKRGG